MKIKKYAFSVAEIIIGLSIIGVIIAVVLVGAFNNGTKTNQTAAETLYIDFDKLYQVMLLTKASGAHSITTLEDINGDKTVDASDIVYFIVKNYTGEQVSSCDKLVTPENNTAGFVCADLSPNAFIGVKYDRACNTEVRVAEGFGRPIETKKTCGYIAYSLKGSKGILGEDFFIYPFLKGRTKKTVN